MVHCHVFSFYNTDISSGSLEKYLRSVVIISLQTAEYAGGRCFYKNRSKYDDVMIKVLWLSFLNHHANYRCLVEIYE